MELFPIYGIALPILTVIAVGLVGTTRRIGFWWAILTSILLTPVGGLLLAVLSGHKHPKREKVRAAANDKP